MPKMKTHKGAAKRFRKTASGKFKRDHAYTSHLFGNKKTKQKRQLRKGTYIHNTLIKTMNKLMPYA